MREETDANSDEPPSTLAQTKSHASAFEVDWEGASDGANPQNWSIARRGVIVLFVSFATLVV